MTLDLFILGLLIVFALFGRSSGALWQMLHLVSIGAGLLVSKALGPAIGRMMGPSVHKGLAVVMATAAVFTLTYAFGHLLAFLLRRRFKETTAGTFDRALGAFLGFSKGALLAWVVLSTLVFFDNPAHGWTFSAPGSKAAGFARRFNALQLFHLRSLDRLSKISELIKNPNAPHKDDVESMLLAADPRLKAVAADPAIQSAGADLLTLLGDPRVRELIADPALARKFADPDAAPSPPMKKP